MQKYKRGKVSQEEKEAIVYDFKHSTTDIDELSESFKRSPDLIKSIIKELTGLSIEENNVSNTTTDLVTSIDESINKKLVKINIDNKSNYVEAKMINGRHDSIKCNLSVYNKVDDDNITNYDWLETQANLFIDKNLTYNEKTGFYDETLIVYITGLSTAQAAIVKVCVERKVNLIFMHYDIVLKDYTKQIILDKFGELSYPSRYLSFLEKYDEAYVYGCNSYNDITVSNNVFDITETYEDDRKVTKQNIYFTTNENDLWELFRYLTDYIQTIDERCTLFVHVNGKFINDRLVKGYTTMRSFNYWKFKDFKDKE